MKGIQTETICKNVPVYSVQSEINPRFLIYIYKTEMRFQFYRVTC